MHSIKATQKEKAQAWDRLMASTANDSTAIMDAWEWLRDTVDSRTESGSPLKRQWQALARVVTPAKLSDQERSARYYETLRYRGQEGWTA